MVITENIIVSDIRNMITSGNPPVDFKIEESQIRYWIYQTVAMFKAQSIQKRKDITDDWVQTISCLDLEQADKSECCEIETGCSILRTTELPRSIETNGDNNYLRVTDMMGNSIPKTTYLQAIYASHGKYTKHKVMWFYKNYRIYIINNDQLSKINVDLLAENPSDLINFVNCDGSTCYSYDSPFPCSMQMANDVVSYIVKNKALPFLQIPQDTTNNTSNDLESTKK